MFVNHFSNPVLFVLLCTLCFANPTLNGIVFAFVCLLILVLLHNTYSIKHPKNKSKNVSSHKSIFFSFFFHCKRKEKITVSLTHTYLLRQKLDFSRTRNHELLIGIVLTRSLCSPCGLYLRECNANTRDSRVRRRKHPQEIHCTLHFSSLLHLLYSHCIYLNHEDIQQISNLFL